MIGPDGLPCIEWPGDRVHGYGRKYVSDGGRKGRQVRVHRWVVEQVEGPLAPGEVVRHLCDNPPCFRYSHLARGRQADNVADMHAAGRYRGGWPKGEKHNTAKLTEAQVRQLRQRREAGESYPALAAAFGIRVSTAWAICQRQIWRQLP